MPTILAKLSARTFATINTVDGDNSQWVSNALFVGFPGSGTLNILNGGKVTAPIQIGFAGGTGVVNVDGTNSLLESSGQVNVGRNLGYGTLNILHGGKVSNIGEGRVGGAGEANVDGANSLWDNGDVLSVDGTLNILNGGKVSNTSAVWWTA